MVVDPEQVGAGTAAFQYSKANNTGKYLHGGCYSSRISLMSSSKGAFVLLPLPGRIPCISVVKGCGEEPVSP